MASRLAASPRVRRTARSLRVGPPALALVAALAPLLLAGCGNDCSRQLADLNKDRKSGPLTSDICDHADWQHDIDSLKDAGREYGWYHG